MPRPRPKHHNPRWHLVNLLPTWISQALTSVAIACLPNLCFSSCGEPNTAIQNAAIAICIMSFAAIVIEGVLFAFGFLRPFASLVMQVVKILVVWAQWAIVALHDTRGPARSSQQWKMAEGLSVLFTALSWPLKSKLWPNWILQLIFIPVLCWARLIGLSLSHPRSDPLSRALSYVAADLLAWSIFYEIWYSLRKNGKRLCLQTYLQVQLLKIGVLFFMLDLIVAAREGWQIQVGGWAQSLFWVVKLSVTLRTPYIAEFVFVAAIYMKRQKTSTEASEDPFHEEDDIEAGAHGKL